MTKVAVLGATGFVGSATVSALRDQGADVTPVSAPRLTAPVHTPTDRPTPLADIAGEAVDVLAAHFEGCDVVVNAAGNPDASSTDREALLGANGILPAVVGAAAQLASVPRFVHVSSAVVQGRLPELDSSDRYDAFSAYARSKVLGELNALDSGPKGTVVYRPPSVHARDRRVTKGIRRLADSPLASVAGDGTRPSPQALVENVASALAFLALCQATPPPIVHHPSENLTTAMVMQLLGQRSPAHLPQPAARALTRALRAVGTRNARIAPQARRVEMLWFGQAQAPSWLEEAGWVPPAGHERWKQLGDEIRNDAKGKTR